MGVKDLWTILEPIKQRKECSEMQGEVIAVDLSVWVVENQLQSRMHGVVKKPHLRNLFFRISNLTQLGVKLVFVVDGKPPELKSDTMAKRQAGQYGRASKTSKPGRSRFINVLKEACVMLDYLGVPYIESNGEAEAMCAFLNSEKIVDAVITDDSDAFLYGALKVYRGYSMEKNKTSYVDCYTAEDAKSRMGLDRERMVALALLLGCDYGAAGVPGVGQATALKFLQALGSCDVIERLRGWRLPSFKSYDKMEERIRQKVPDVTTFPDERVIEEFMTSRDTVPTKPFVWTRPKLQKFQEFQQQKLEWPEEYSRKQLLPLLTLFDLRQSCNEEQHDTCEHLKPVRIVKPRVRNGQKCFEIEWELLEKARNDTSFAVDEPLTTIECEQLFVSAYPEMVEEFLERKNKKPKAQSRMTQWYSVRKGKNSIPTTTKSEDKPKRSPDINKSVGDTNRDDVEHDKDSDVSGDSDHDDYFLPLSERIRRAAEQSSKASASRDVTRTSKSVVDSSSSSERDLHADVEEGSEASTLQKDSNPPREGESYCDVCLSSLSECSDADDEDALTSQPVENLDPPPLQDHVNFDLSAQSDCSDDESAVTLQPADDVNVTRSTPLRRSQLGSFSLMTSMLDQTDDNLSNDVASVNRVTPSIDLAGDDDENKLRDSNSGVHDVSRDGREQQDEFVLHPDTEDCCAHSHDVTGTEVSISPSFNNRHAHGENGDDVIVNELLSVDDDEAAHQNTELDVLVSSPPKSPRLLMEQKRERIRIKTRSKKCISLKGTALEPILISDQDSTHAFTPVGLHLRPGATPSTDKVLRDVSQYVTDLQRSRKAVATSHMNDTAPSPILGQRPTSPSLTLRNPEKILTSCTVVADSFVDDDCSDADNSCVTDVLNTVDDVITPALDAESKNMLVMNMI